jgi:hypothetical protein
MQMTHASTCDSVQARDCQPLDSSHCLGHVFRPHTQALLTPSDQSRDELSEPQVSIDTALQANMAQTITATSDSMNEPPVLTGSIHAPCSEEARLSPSESTRSALRLCSRDNSPANPPTLVGPRLSQTNRK